MSSSPSLFLDCEKNISVNIFISIQYFKHLNLISSQSVGTVSVYGFDFLWLQVRTLRNSNIFSCHSESALHLYLWINLLAENSCVAGLSRSWFPGQVAHSTPLLVTSRVLSLGQEFLVQKKKQDQPNLFLWLSHHSTVAMATVLLS